MHNLDRMMQQKKIVPHYLAGVWIQKTRDAKRVKWLAEFQDAQARGYRTSFFKDFLILRIPGLPHLIVTDILNGHEKICPSIGAAMGHIQEKTFRCTYLMP